MAAIPEIKKKIHSFLTKEDGKISKEALIKTGILLGAVASLKDVSAGHSNTLGPITPPGTSVSVSHNHHDSY